MKDKARLLEMATARESIPSSSAVDPEEKRLGTLLYNLVTEGNRDANLLDIDFRNEIMAIAPLWFRINGRGYPRLRSPADTAIVSALVTLAESGAPKPRQNDAHSKEEAKLAQVLISKTLKGLATYDEVLHRKLLEMAPHWFSSHVQEALVSSLILLAENGTPRPRLKQQRAQSAEEAKLAQVLLSKTSPSSLTYDKELHNQLLAIAPHWFFSVRSKTRIEELISLAKSGAPKPRQDDARSAEEKDFVILLHTKTLPSSKRYDPDFHQKLRNLAPHWFANDENQGLINSLMRRAAHGAPRPWPDNSAEEKKLDLMLRAITTPSNDNYDENVHEKLVAAAPHWFRKKDNQDFLDHNVRAPNNDDYREPHDHERRETRYAETQSLRDEFIPSNRNVTNGKEQVFSSRRAQIEARANELYQPAPSGKRRVAQYLADEDAIDQSHIATLILLAKNGARRPDEYHPQSALEAMTGEVLRKTTSTRERCYDKAVHETLLDLAPHWFFSHVNEAMISSLISLAENGAPRPKSDYKAHPEEAQLAGELSRRTSPSSSFYDRNLHERLLDIAPHWFREQQR